MAPTARRAVTAWSATARIPASTADRTRNPPPRVTRARRATCATSLLPSYYPRRLGVVGERGGSWGETAHRAARPGAGDHEPRHRPGAAHHRAGPDRRALHLARRRADRARRLCAADGRA